MGAMYAELSERGYKGVFMHRGMQMNAIGWMHVMPDYYQWYDRFVRRPTAGVSAVWQKEEGRRSRDYVECK